MRFSFLVNNEWTAEDLQDATTNPFDLGVMGKAINASLGTAGVLRRLVQYGFSMSYTPPLGAQAQYSFRDKVSAEVGCKFTSRTIQAEPRGWRAVGLLATRSCRTHVMLPSKGT